jgi:large subunit ribosomal protein L23
MSIFKRKKKEEKKEENSQVSETVEKEKVKSQVSQAVNVKNLKDIKNVLIKPIITEKAANLSALNKYVFLVTKDANKNLVKQNVALRYNVKVEKVDIVNIKGKTKYYRNRPYKKPDIKKAIVTLRKGDKIEIQ